MKRFFLYIFLVQTLCWSCGEEASKTSHHSALPHQLETSEAGLSEADKRKLATANGKEVTSILVQDIEQMFDAAKEKRHIFSFWKLDCAACIASLKNMTNVLKSIDNDQFRLIFINLDDKSKLGQVNSLIREENIFAETYHLDAKKTTWFDGIYENWKGELPATFFVQEDENLMVRIPTEVDEAILQDFLKLSDQ